MSAPCGDDVVPSALFAACRWGHAEVVSYLTRLKADVHELRASDGATCVYVSAQQGHESCIEVLGWVGADMDASTREGLTPIYAAAAQGQSAAIHKLWAAGADLNGVGPTGLRPVIVAACRDHAKAVEECGESP